MRMHLARRLPVAQFVAYLLLAACCGPASAWDWKYPLGNVATAEIYPTGAAFDTQGRLWATGFASPGYAVVRYDVPGAPPQIVSAGENAPHPVDRLVAGAAGAMLGLSTPCAIVNYEADGTYRWKQSISSNCIQGPLFQRQSWPVDAFGGQWSLVFEGMVRLGLDGRVLTRASPSGHEWRTVAVDTRDGRFFGAAVVGGDRVPTLSAFDRHGAALWQWRGNPGATIDTLQIGTAPDGSLRVAGLDTRGLFVAAIDAAGAPRWNRNVAASAALGTVKRLYTPMPDATGATWIGIESDDATAPLAIRLDADGSPRFSRSRNEIGQAPGTAANGSMQAAPDGDLLISRRGILSRIAADGTMQFSRALTGDGQQEPETDIVGIETAGVVTVLAREPASAYGRLRRLARDGTELAAPIARATGGFGAYAARVPQPDGSLIVWTRNVDGARELLRLDIDGNVAWKVATPGVWTLGTNVGSAAVAANADRACTLDARRIDDTRSEQVLECRLAADGRSLWSRALATGDTRASELSRQVFVDADGAVSAWYASEAAGIFKVGLTRFDKNGATLAAKEWPDGAFFSNVPFNSAFALLRIGGEYVVVDRAGDERYRPASHLFGSTSRITFDDDGGLIIVASRGGPQQTVTRLDAAGTLRWSRQFASTQSTPRPAIVRGNAVYVATCCKTGSSSAPYLYSLARLVFDSGEPAWTRDFVSNVGPVLTPTLAATPSGDAIVAVGSRNDRIFVDVVDATDGRVHVQRREKCYGGYCLVFSPFVDTRSRLHLNDYGESSPSALVRWQIPSPQAHNVRLDQPGIAGAWWSPYANGEGFVLDYLPDSRTLFMPWFTFSRDGGNDPAGQRWYVVQGQVPANAVEVELPITESTGGAFDAGPATTPAIVGKATLTFTDCDNGTLRYRFDEGRNGGATGTITLSRLSPATHDCILADGTTQTRTSPPANGFDARMSGSWFEPATSGQGLQLTVQPGGIFFAPWFTYDPAGISDDPGKQHWYTVQGSLANARNGVAELPIVQTIGGAFDSMPTNNMYTVGKATITMLACDRATLDYRFDDNELAAPTRARSGSIDLVKAGGCAP